MANDALRTEIQSLLPKAELSRREAIVTTLATGFALAVSPAGSETITTSSEGLVAGEVKIPVGDMEIPAYRAMPAKGGPFPVALVVQEIFGVHEHIKDVCRRFAKLGYMAIATELYARQGDVSNLKSIDEIRAVVSKVPDDQVMGDLDATVEYAKESGKGDVARLGITGFCWGGRIVWLYAAHSKLLKAGVAWYGRLVGEKSDLFPKHPLDVATELKAPVLGLYAGKDQGIPLDSVEKMRAAVKQAKVDSEIVVYPEAQHGFHADYRPSYNEANAKEGWAKLQVWFKKYGAA
jgi:carboxymethylenebutenolidase